ncbi:MAG: hypothetical protein KAZ71_01135 [Bacteroidia bacterium]|nr:hypothetical protein [Bacteroidia bacterium]
MSHSNKKIHIHSDLDKAAEAQAEYVINQNPIDRIRETVQLILRVYSTKEKKPRINKIYFDKE